MRPTLLPSLLILVLLGLVVLLPKREAPTARDGAFVLPGATAAGPDVAQLLAQLPELELDEPPSWAQASGADEVRRHLDRLDWGSHGALVAARRSLEEHQGGLADEVLSRLRALDDSRVILISKLIGVLAAEGQVNDDPAIVEELVRRAFSPSSLVAKAALKALAYHPSPAALGGILDRRSDPDLEVQAHARAALAERASRGDEEALLYILDDLERSTRDPDLAYVTVLGEVEPSERVLEVLREIVDEALWDSRLAAQASLLNHGDEQTMEDVSAMLADGDLTARMNALRMAALSGQVFAWDQWQTLVEGRQRTLVLPLFSMLERAVLQGHEQALLAIQLLETVALDPTHSCNHEALDVLLRQGHPLAVERTRVEVQQAVGAYLSVTADRVIHAGPEIGGQFAELAAERLAAPDLDPADRVVLCRLLSHVDPARGAQVIVELCLQGPAPNLLTFLSRLGPYALDELAGRLEDDRAAGLFIFTAATSRVAEALPYLELLVLDPARDPALRRLALDAVVRLETGPREEVLRRVAGALQDDELQSRARLLFWNYL